MQDYRKLHVRQKAHRLALDVNATSAYLKAPEAWAVRDQIVRAAVSVPSNMPREAAGAPRPTSAGSSGIRWDLVMNLSMICCSRGISTSCLGLRIRP